LPYSIQQLVAKDTGKLATLLALDTASARLEVQYLLQYALQKPRAWLLAHFEQQLTPDQWTTYEKLLQRRLQGEPVAYILGEREFFGLKFKVTPATLIPRPETELLVEQALEKIPLRQKSSVLDLGTGSGAIALSIAHTRPEAEVTAVDASMQALTIAKENAQRLDIHNTRFMHSSWFSGLAGQYFDLVVSNPPYVAESDPHLQQGDLPFEPRSALVSGAEGLDDIRYIVAGVPEHLHSGGWLLLEHGYDQSERVRELLHRAGMAEVYSARDLSGIERVSGGRKQT
jgi:release factor glutamine methyltransferase